MMYEYAIDPALFSKQGLYRQILSSMGMEQGRLVSKFPRGWAKRAHDAVLKAPVGDVEKMRMSRAIVKLGRAPVAYRRQGFSWSDGTAWLDNALTEHRRCPFRAILSSLAEDAVSDNTESIIDLETMDPDENLWTNPSGQSIQRHPEAMANCVAPLLDLASEIRFIDPHFRVDRSRFTRPLKAWLARIMERPHGGKLPKLEYHVCDDIDESFYRARIVHDLEAIVPANCELQVVCWPRIDMHNRFILTNVGGVQFGHGLDAWEDGQPDTDQIHRLTEDVWRELWDRYSSDAVVCTAQGKAT